MLFVKQNYGREKYPKLEFSKNPLSVRVLRKDSKAFSSLAFSEIFFLLSSGLTGNFHIEAVA